MQPEQQTEQSSSHAPYTQQGGYQGPSIIINNVASSAASASAVAGVRGGYGRPRRQSAGTHLVLFLLTAGIGNVLYAMYISSWNRRHGF